MKLNQPYYIEPRENSVNLGGKWDFGFSDCQLEAFEGFEFFYSATLPKSVYHCLHEAGVLPDPYYGTNSKEYHWVDEKIWYFRKKFTLDTNGENCNAFLCFDGVSYYSRVWVNGVLLGDHEGMYGGPVCDVAAILDFHGENEIVVEIKPCNYGVKDTYDGDNLKGTNREIVPWNIVRDNHTSNGDFIVMGIWNRIRLEIVNKLHISRPYMYTVSADAKNAELYLEFEIADGRITELKPFSGYNDHCYSYTRAYDNGLTGKTLDEEVEIRIIVTESGTDKTVYQSTDYEKLIDFDGLLMDKTYYELQFFTKTVRIDNPKLWYPVGLGEPFLYNVRIEMYKDGILCDTQTFETGIRSFEARRTAGRKYRNRWENFLFSVNGKEFFLKGINWTPIDFLYSIDEKEYEWTLTLAKNAGVQLLRIWSGGGMPETDTFYRICDKLGIMVWQDHMIANTADTHSYPHDIFESQEAYNVYRIRNHPSLVIHCGGNEFNPYSTGNAANMFILSRVMKDLDPSRIFHYTTSDKGSAHIYRDMEPVWYRHLYKELPFVGESGIHSFPTYRTLKKLISKEESSSVLGDLTSEEFTKKFPELINHFTEYNPDRIPRMLARASQISDVSSATLEEMCEATQVQAYEYYTLMIQAMNENYPYCGGIMPWVFKRPWATIGIQTVDGGGQPVYPYYAVQNTYRPLGVCFKEQWSVIKPEESVPLGVKILNQNGENLLGMKLTLTVYKPDMTVAAEYISDVGVSSVEYDFGEFVPDKSFTDKCFLICADLTRSGVSAARTSYFIKCTSALSDEKLYNKYRSGVTENLYFSTGPWLKDCVASANKAVVSSKVSDAYSVGNYTAFDIVLCNESEYPAYPVTIEVDDADCRFFLNDNFFLLKPQEVKTVRVTCDKAPINGSKDVSVHWYNR